MTGKPRSPRGPSKFSEATRERAVRLVLENSETFGGEAGCGSACRRAGRGARLGRCVGGCVRPAPRQARWSRGWTGRTAGSQQLERENAELEQTVEVLKAATSFFARECDPRPPTGELCEFIDVHRERFGVAPICRALSAQGCRSPRTPTTPGAAAGPSKRALWDTTITEVLAGFYEPDAHGRRRPESLYGSREDVGPPEPGGHRGRQVHRGTADARSTAGGA